MPRRSWRHSTRCRGSADPGCRHQLDGRGIRSAGPRHLCAAGAVTNEYLRLLKELWTKNEVEFRGDFVHVSALGFQPKPVQRPHPPIWIGGHSLPALRCAALPGDGWMPDRPAAVVAARSRRYGEQNRASAGTLAEGQPRRGRGQDFIYGSGCHNRNTGFAASASARPTRGDRRRSGSVPGLGRVQLQHQSTRIRDRRAGRSYGAVRDRRDTATILITLSGPASTSRSQRRGPTAASPAGFFIGY